MNSVWQKSMAQIIGMKIPDSHKLKISILAAITVLTLGIHYGWVLEPIFPGAHWIHAVHGRFCYIPIVIASAWFGLRGGLIMAATISVFVLPLLISRELGPHDLAGELVEIVFYFAMAGLVGGLVERELRTRRKQEEMRLHLERSRQLSMVGRIAAGVAHEIKNPLASIKGAVEILADEQTSPGEKVEFREILYREIKRMDGTIAEFLAFARPRETILAKLDLSETIRASVRQIEPHAAAEGVSIFSDMADGIIINGDRARLHEMALNLLLNAIEASPKGGGVKVILGEGDRGRVLLAFEDSGKGIKEEDRERIFEPFYTTKPSGTGLGLAIVKSIVDSHHGEIRVVSRRDLGTRLEVTLPAYREEGI